MHQPNSGETCCNRQGGSCYQAQVNCSSCFISLAKFRFPVLLSALINYSLDKHFLFSVQRLCRTADQGWSVKLGCTDPGRQISGAGHTDSAEGHEAQGTEQPAKLSVGCLCYLLPASGNEFPGRKTNFHPTANRQRRLIPQPGVLLRASQNP